jgi:predicted PolB exonuclease-like 3'-5' exonuclease
MKAPGSVKNILFIDIETVPCAASYEELPSIHKACWNKKAVSLGKLDPQETEALFLERAAVYAEFGKIIAIGVGFITFNQEEDPMLHVQCIHGDDEHVILNQFKKLLEEKFQQEAPKLCAHNGKEFDFPYLCRRMLVNGIGLPHVLDLSSKKPWEVPHLDTMEMWKFGDKKSFTSLDLLAHLFGIASSKNLMDGRQVTHYYYTEKALPQIAAYCMQDVVVTAQIFLKLNNWQTIQETNIIFA